MLFTRIKQGGSFTIGDDIRVTVKHVNGKQSVQLKIEAPRDVPVMRGEVWDRMQAEEFKIIACDYED